MAPFAESKNRPTFIDDEDENLLLALSSFGSERSTSPTGWSTDSSSQETEFHERRSISFNPELSFETIPHRSSLSRKERAAVWMQSQDYTHARRDAKETAHLLSAWGETNLSDDDASESEDNDGTRCFLGLEGYTTVGRTMRKSLKRRAAKVVQEEQYTQEREGCRPNVEKIALGYAKISESASAFAWLRALKNQDQIREYVES
jgi:uncharacterized cupin superfamily protein